MTVPRDVRYAQALIEMSRGDIARSRAGALTPERRGRWRAALLFMVEELDSRALELDVGEELRGRMRSASRAARQRVREIVRTPADAERRAAA